VKKLSFLTAIVAAAAMTASFIVPASSKTAAPTSATATVPNKLQDVFVRGTASDGGTFRGRLDINRFFVNDAGQLRGAGDLSGKVRNSAGEVTEEFANERVRFPVGVSTGVGPLQPDCPILHLEIGPIDLDLLGLVIHVDEIVIDITAEPGPGNLLGNLLCAIAHLLDGDPTGTVNDILAQILNAIRQLLRIFG
jgi:hypothetical protein